MKPGDRKVPEEHLKGKMIMRAASGRVSSDDLDPKLKPRTLSFWYTRETGCLYIREQELQN